MIVGRLFWGGATYLCIGMSGGHFGLSAFLAGAVTNALPGILLQILLIPLIVDRVSRKREQAANGSHTDEA